MKRVIVAGLVGMACLGGCVFFKQAQADYQVGKTTPLTGGETAPKDSATALVAPLEGVPYGSVAKFAIPALAMVFTYLRGRRLRKGLPVSATPATGFFGAKVGLEWIIQAIANISHGTFEWGTDNSPIKRGIKVVLAIALAGLTAAAASPSVAATVASHPEMVATLTSLAAVIAAVEKALSQVLPVASPPPTP